MPSSGPGPRYYEPAVDCLFLGAVVAISVAPYVRGLGFYIDDFEVLGRMQRSPDQSLFGLYHAVRPGTAQRPLQAFLLAGLYRLFGWHPLGYHVVNIFLLAIVAALMYLVLRELRLPRLVCVAIPLVYSMLPNYATERFWPDTFQISLSTAFYLLSLYAGLRAVRSSSWAVGVWVAVAVAGIAGSLLSYEIVFPLFAINLVLVWWAGRDPPEEASQTRRFAVVGLLAIALVAVGILKTTLVAKYGSNGYAFGFYRRHPSDPDPGLRRGSSQFRDLSRRSSLRGRLDLAAPLFGRERDCCSRDWPPLLRLPAPGSARTMARFPASTWRALMKVGLVAFVLGYAIFLTTPDFLMRSAGVDNRINEAATLGIAAMLVGGLGLAAAPSAWGPSRHGVLCRHRLRRHRRHLHHRDVVDVLDQRSDAATPNRHGHRCGRLSDPPSGRRHPRRNLPGSRPGANLRHPVGSTTGARVAPPRSFTHC